MKKALILGATGVVGGELVRQLCRNENYEKVVVWARRELNFSHKKLETKIVNFDEIANLPSENFDEIFCALGTTIKQAGSHENFEKVDLTYPLEAAKWGKNNDVKRFILISAPGANANSRNFYLQTKGRAQEQIEKLGFESLQIVHPPLIRGERENFRLGESLAILLFRIIPKSLFKTYRPMSGAQIAEAMILRAQSPNLGVEIYEPREVLEKCEN